MRRAACLIAVVLAALGQPATAEPIADYGAGVRALMADDARLLGIGFRLTTGNAALCADIQPGIGLTLLDAATFDQPRLARQALGLSGDMAVDAVAKGSPADAAGITTGAAITDIQGVNPAGLASYKPPLGRGEWYQALIEADLAKGGPVTIRLGERVVSLHGVPACRSRFELVTRGKGASADGTRVQVSRALLAMAKSDDEAAFLIAHELAHNILHHKARLAASGRSAAHIRETELEADRLALWLMRNAGYDAAAAPVFMRRWGPKGLAALMQAADHDRAETRARALEAELALVQAAEPGPSGLRDWRSRFPQAPSEVKVTP